MLCELGCNGKLDHACTPTSDLIVNREIVMERQRRQRKMGSTPWSPARYAARSPSRREPVSPGYAMMRTSRTSTFAPVLELTELRSSEVTSQASFDVNDDGFGRSAVGQHKIGMVVPPPAGPCAQDPRLGQPPSIRPTQRMSD